MADIPIWSGNATFDPLLKPTAFGFYDSDNDFQDDAPHVAKWCAHRLGYPLVDIELQDINFFTAFEEAVTEYGAHLYQFQIRNNIGNLIGYSTGSADHVYDEETGEFISSGSGFNQIDISSVYGTSAGGSGTTGGGSGATYNLTNDRLYSASLDVKKGTQKYNLLTSTPEYASVTLTFGPWTAPLNHSESIALTDTEGTTVHYRATVGLSNGGWNGVSTEDTPISPIQLEASNMTTGSDEYRTYRHVSASRGEFVTGSYGDPTGVSTPIGLDGVVGSGANSDLSASFDSFIKTLKHPGGAHAKSFTVSSSYNEDQTIYYAHITQTVEGTGGNTSITNNLTGVTAPSVFSGGNSGLNFEMSGSAIQAKTKQIKIKKVYHHQPAAINRYFDPYAGTGTGIQSLMQTFGFGNYSPGVNFMLMPMYFDALKLQAIEMNDKIRKSAYHFEINAGKFLKLFPIPTRDTKLWFEYTMAESSNDLTTGASTGGTGDEDEPKATNTITNISNVPYKRPTYRFINEPGRQWIRKYALALCKEMLGGIRGKYQSLPIPGSETTLDYSRLLSEATAEKEALIIQLREDLDETTTRSQNERQRDESDFKQQGLALDNPYQIYIH